MYNVGARRLVCNGCIVRAINVGNWHDTYTAMRRITALLLCVAPRTEMLFP